MISPQGRVVMVSGASRGIGRAIAGVLHQAGYSLSLGAREPAALDVLIAGLAGDRAMAHAYEATDSASAPAWVAATEARFGRIDAVVAGAGIIHDFNPAAPDADETALDAMWEVNVKGPARLARAAWPHLVAAGHGRVVIVASASGKRVRADSIGGYAMTKHAAVALAHALRFAGWEAGVRATALCPGYVATDMTAKVTALPAEAMTQADDLGILVASVIGLPDTASVAELAVNCVLEPTL